MDREAWSAAVHGVAKNWTRLSNLTELSHPYMTTGKRRLLENDYWKKKNFVGKVMSLLFNMLSKLVIAFLPRSQMSFNFMAAVTICSDFGAPQNKV